MGYFLLNLVTLYALEFICLTLHEFGHATAALLLRFRLFSITIGYGKRLFQTSLGNVSLELNLIPLLGLTAAVTKNASWWKLRTWLFIFAGPFTHVLLLLGAYAYSPRSFYPGYSLPKIFSSFAPLEVFIVANVLLLVGALLPRTSIKGVGEYKSDGMQLVKVLFMEELSTEFSFDTLLPRLEAYFAIRRGNFEEARFIYEDLIRQNPDDASLKHDLAISNLGLGEVPEARQLFVSLIDNPRFKKAEGRAVLFNNIAWTSALEGTPDLLAAADKCSQEALQSSPNHALFMGTRGAVLVCNGHSQDGINLLKTAFRKHSVPESRAACASFIALGYARLDDQKLSNKWMVKARSNAPGYWLIAVVEGKIAKFLTSSEVSPPPTNLEDLGCSEAEAQATAHPVRSG